MIYSQGITSSVPGKSPVLFALLVTLVCAASISAQNQCTQKLAELPAAAALFGFHLGMTKEEVKAQVPQTVFGRTDDFGISKTTINPDFEPQIDKTRFQGVRSISLDFLDGKLTSLWIGYDSAFKTQTTDDFVKMVSDSLHLPNAWSSWKSRGQQMRCADFQMTVTTVAGAPSFRILDQIAEDTVSARREAKEQQNAAAEAAATETPAATEETSDIVGDKHTRSYYPAGCQPTKDITETSRVAFKSTAEAERAGFKVAKECH
jgi:hypothetical protein